MILSTEAYEKLDIRFVLDKVQVHTPYGRVKKQAMKPFGRDQAEDLNRVFDLTEEAMDMIGRHRYTLVEVRNQFKHMKDLTGSLERIAAGDPLTVPELFEIKSLVKAMGAVAGALDRAGWNLAEDHRVERMEAVEGLLDPDGLGVNTFYLYDSYSPDLGRVRGQLKAVERQMRAVLKTLRVQVEDRLGIRLRPNGEVTVSKDNGPLLEKLAADPQLTYSSETYMNKTYRIADTPEIDLLRKEKEDLQGEEDAVCAQVRAWLTAELLQHLSDLRVNIDAVGNLDLLLAKAYFALGTKSVRPRIVTEGVVSIVEGRHLKVEDRLRREDKPYTPISLRVESGVTCITGANMGGKTVSLKMLGMLTVVMQMGLFVPAASADLGLLDFVFVSIGDLQDADMGLSTFGAEIVKVQEAVKMADGRGLILIDELARGTNPKEGYAISKALMNYLKEKPSLTVITTHFDGLADDEDIRHLQVSGLSGLDFKSILLELQDQEKGMDLLHERMDYTLKEIHSNEEVPKDAINISRLMGLSESILQNAKDILSDM